MVDLIVACSEKLKVCSWIDVLEPLYSIGFYDNIEQLMSENEQNKQKTFLVLDASLLKAEYPLSLICQVFYKVLIINENCKPDQKIQYIYDGAWGYSDHSVNKQLIIRTIEGILNNEVWLERQLIPQLLQGAVSRSNLGKDAVEFNPEILKTLANLTHREIEVIRLVYNGVDIISISQTLNISNRTVKAHLSAVYRKLNVPDRFQLIVFLKNLHVGHLSNVNDYLGLNKQIS